MKCNSIILLLVFLCLFTTCGNDQTTVFNNAEWISDERPLPESDSLFYLDRPAPLFRKEFNIEKEVESARLYITAAGYYRFSLNGISCPENILSPAWTDYSKRIYYSTYDLGRNISEGMNCIGVTLGNGMYNPLPLRMWGHLNLRDEITVGKPCFIAKLVIKYSNGTREEIVTDRSWKYSYGPLRKNDVYIGVAYDASYEQHGWELPGFDEAEWEYANESGGPGGIPVKRFFPPVVIVDTINPVGINALAQDTCIVDMGINFTGTYTIRLRGHKDDTIVFRFGERVYDSGKLNPMTAVCGQIKRKGVGGTGAPPIAWQSDYYVFDSDTTLDFTPSFTFHTYRFMEISGLDYSPGLPDIKGLFLSTDLESNSFSSSSQIINSVQEATVRTFRSNLIGVQSDCAAREKFGYGGDLNATSEAFIYNFNMKEFYRKTVYDWVDAINDSVFVDTAPYAGINYCGLSWESAFLTTQYYLYLYYNDKDIISELYDFDKAWMEKVRRLHPEGIVDAGLGDHESLLEAPVELTGTAHYLQCARIMKEFADLMDDTEGFKKYSALESELSELIVNNFWKDQVYMVKNKQTLYSILLYFNLLSDADCRRAVDSLVSSLRNDGGITTGIFGTKYILSALSDNGEVSVAYDIVSNTSYPGWGYMISRGATTIWETWKESDNTFSNCHPMFGSVSEWFFKHLAGINPDPGSPGFSKIILKPLFPAGLENVQCKFNSASGVIVSGWQKKNNNTYIYSLSVPGRATAQLILPSCISLAGISDPENNEIIDMDLVRNKENYLLPAGRYELILEIKNID